MIIHFSGPRLSIQFLQATLTAISEFFRDYKVYDGIPGNKFGLGNKPANKVHGQ